MNSVEMVGGGVAIAAMAVSLAWQVAVLVLLLKIWKRVKHLPG